MGTNLAPHHCRSSRGGSKTTTHVFCDRGPATYSFGACFPDLYNKDNDTACFFCYDEMSGWKRVWSTVGNSFCWYYQNPVLGPQPGLITPHHRHFMSLPVPSYSPAADDGASPSQFSLPDSGHGDMDLPEVLERRLEVFTLGQAASSNCIHSFPSFPRMGLSSRSLIRCLKRWNSGQGLAQGNRWSLVTP